MIEEMTRKFGNIGLAILIQVTGRNRAEETTGNEHRRLEGAIAVA